MNAIRVREYLGHILDAIASIETYVKDFGKDDFLEDRRTQQAVVLNLIVIGEAATRLIEKHGDFIDRHRDIPWRSMRGMRNRIAHGYFEIDLDIVWETVTTSLPNLRAQVVALMGSR